MKAAGELAVESANFDEEVVPVGESLLEDRRDFVSAPALSSEDDSIIDIESYRPNITQDHTWYLSEMDLGTLFDSCLPFASLINEHRVDCGGLWRHGNWGRGVTLPSVSCRASNAAGRKRYTSTFVLDP